MVTISKIFTFSRCVDAITIKFNRIHISYPQYAIVFAHRNSNCLKWTPFHFSFWQRVGVGGHMCVLLLSHDFHGGFFGFVGKMCEMLIGGLPSNRIIVHADWITCFDLFCTFLGQFSLQIPKGRYSNTVRYTGHVCVMKYYYFWNGPSLKYHSPAILIG
jgi:hypothetical protein